jgi:hypothetical protein
MKHRVVVRQVRHHILLHVIAHGVGVPRGPADQMLHAIRAGLPGPLHDRPAVLRGRSDSSPSTKCFTRRRGPTRDQRWPQPSRSRSPSTIALYG